MGARSSSCEARRPAGRATSSRSRPPVARRAALASTPESDERSVLPSPRRDEVAVISDRGGRSALYLAPLAGGAPRELSSDPTRNYFSPRWSPDGERVAAISTRRSDGVPRLAGAEGLAETHVVVFDRDGRVLFDAPGFMPDWMPPWH